MKHLASLRNFGCLILFTHGCAGAEIDGEQTLQPPVSRDAGAQLFLDAGLDMPLDAAAIEQDSSALVDVSVVDAAEEMGDPACIELSNCLAECQDPECSLGCRNAATEDATDLYDAIFVCASANDCSRPGGSYDRDCMEMHCDAVQRACLGPPPPGPPPPMGNGTCAELNACLDRCTPGDLSCRDGCVAATSQLGYDQLTTVQTCLETAGCMPGDYACLRRVCEVPLTACYGNVVRPMGTGDCAELNRCLGDCPDGDDGCTDGCYRASGDDGFNQFTALAICVGDSQCPAGDGDCQRDACADEFNTCFGPPPPPPMGNMSCEELNECITNCAEGDQLCINNCIGRSTQVAYDALVAAVDCLNQAECDPDDAACRQAACQAEIETCLGPPPMPMGNGSCLQLNECLNQCGPNDDDCPDDCVRASSPIGYQRFQSAIECIQDAGCMPNDVACQQANCAAEIQLCLGQ